MLGRVAYELGDDDQAAEAFAETRQLIETFATGLSPERAAAFLATATVRELLADAGA